MNFYSETKFYTEIKRATQDGVPKVQLQDQDGVNVIFDEKDLNILNSASEFKGESKLNQTDLINVLMSNPKTVCSVYFQKQDKAKTKKAYNAEVEAQAEEAKQALLDSGLKGITELLKNPISPVIPGEMRLMQGYHFGTQDERGRINFMDMEDSKKLVKGVDPRTIEYVIVNGIRYIKK